jgi:tRNA A-37 threonylcarbamoyl transferase component Bud32
MDPSSRVGTVLDGRYRIERLLGQGGMGTVYRAHHLAMDRPVAVKVLRGNLASDPIAARRFALEAKTTTKVDSPYAVKVFDFGITNEGETFMVMEYLDGRTAQRELDVDGPMEMRRALHVIRQALAGLAAAHAVGVIHRDIKPENLLLMRQGDDPDACKVLDFGVAKLMVQAVDPATALTREGMVFGTPEFMSPEQACGQPLDLRSDLYSLMATLYSLLTGEPLFHGSSAVEVLSKHVTTPPPRLVDRPGLHHLHALDQVMQRALAKKPGARYRDAAELEKVLAFLAPASEPRGLAGSPTMSTPALQPSPGATPDSPLGLFDLAEELEREWGADEGEGGSRALFGFGATGAAPLAAADFRPGATGYLPRITPSVELEASASISTGISASGMMASAFLDAGPEASPSTRAVLQAVAPRRRWVPVVVASALAVVAVVALVAWSFGRHPDAARPVANDRGDRGDRERTGTPAPAVDAGPSLPPDAPTTAAAGDAGPEVANGATPAAPDAGNGTGTGSGSGRPQPVARPRPIDQRKLREHLDASRAARSAGKLIAQLSQADLALEISPRDRDALFLRADALLSAGDKVRGCKEMKRLRGAQSAERAAQAGCP